MDERCLDQLEPVVSVIATAAQIVEGALDTAFNPIPGVFEITTTGTGAGNITVHYTITGTATATGANADYTQLSGTVTVLKNQKKTLNVISIVDSLPEDAETVILTIDPDPSYVVDLKNTATVTIGDDDSVNMVSVSASYGTASETTTGQFYFSRAASPASALTVR